MYYLLFFERIASEIDVPERASTNPTEDGAIIATNTDATASTTERTAVQIMSLSLINQLFICVFIFLLR
jgi:hypothetical protein